MSTVSFEEVVNIEREIVSADKGNYEIENEINILGTHYFTAYDKKADLPYMVGNKIRNDILVGYDDLILTDSYVAALEEWNRRITEGIEKIKQEQARFGDLSILTKDDVETIKPDTSIKNKVVVIRPDCLIHESQYSQKQLYFVESGFGVEGNSRGRSVFCRSISDDSKVRFDRKDVLGVIRSDKIPDWAKEKINEIQKAVSSPVTASPVNLLSMRK